MAVELLTEPDVEETTETRRRAPVFDFVPNRIPVHDAIDIKWFLDDPPVARAAASSFGASIARMQLFGHGSTPCLRCGGNRKTGKAGTGFAPRSGRAYRLELEVYRRRELRANAYAVVRDPERQQEIFDLFNPAEGWELSRGYKPVQFITRETVRDLWPELPLELVWPCKPCGSRGVVQRKSSRRKPITARPTGSSVQMGGGDPSANVDDVALVRWCRVDRRLARTDFLEPGARRTLEHYYDPTGGSFSCLWLLTDEGLEVVKAAPNPQHLTAVLLLHNEREAQRLSPDPARGALHARAETASVELAERAFRAWNVAGLEGYDR